MTPASTSANGAEDDTDQLSANERARERVGQPKSGVKRPPNRNAARPSGRPAPRKRQRQGRSTSATAGIFGGAFVVLAVVVIILISTLSSGGKAGTAITFKPVTTPILTAVTQVPASELTAAGLGGTQVSTTGAFAATPGQPLLTQGGKPVLVYEGAEYCPFCAAARWPLVIALSRFGKFTGLGTVGSSPYDVYASTHTFSFAKAHYTSKYLVFSPVELESNVCIPAALISTGCEQYESLMLQTTTERKLLSTYDVAKYFPGAVKASGGSGLWIPFFDWGGKFVESGGLYSPGVITLGAEGSKPWLGWHPFTWSQITATFGITSQGPGQAILGAANFDTAAICDMTNNQPASVCNTSLIKQAQKELPS